MLTGLGSALSGWQPAGGGRRDPLVAIRAAWGGIVGDEIARAAQPVALTDGALIVVTSSSGWSHQLAFLEPRILEGLAGIPEARDIARLRFRIGRPRPPGGGPARPQAVRPTRERTVPAAGPAPVTAAEALARLRRAIERRRSAHASAGGRFCAGCAVSIERGTTCVPCRDAVASERRAAAERVLFEMPWLAPELVVELVDGLDVEAYDRIRRDLLRGWLDELRLARARHRAKAPIDRTRLRKLASSYVLLDSRVDPSKLDLDPIRRNSLGDLYDFVVAIETAEPPPPPSRVSKDESRRSAAKP